MITSNIIYKNKNISTTLLTFSLLLNLSFAYKAYWEFNPKTKLYNGYGFDDGIDTNSKYPRFSADFNNDKIEDIMVIKADGVYVALSTGSRTDQLVFDKYTADFGFNHGYLNNGNHGRVLGDINGDGCADIMGILDDGIYVGFSNCDGTFQSGVRKISNLAPNHGWGSQDGSPRLLGDFNKDGMMDIYAFSHAGLLICLSNGTGFDSCTGISSFNHFSTNGGFISQEVHPRYIEDVNGDGFYDIIGIGATEFLVSINNKVGGFNAPTTYITPTKSYTVLDTWNNIEGNPRFIKDIDNDGKADFLGISCCGIILAYSQETHYQQGINNAGDHYLGQTSNNDFNFQNDIEFKNGNNRNPRILGDIDGDGFQDLIGFQDDGIYVLFNDKYCSHFTRDINNNCDCIAGYIESGVAACLQKSCEIMCKSCAINANQCLVCQGSMNNKSPEPDCLCLPNFYMNGIQECLPCSHECEECETIDTKCTQCKTQLNRRNTAPNCSCEDNYFENSSQECEQCAPKCSKCSDFDTCTECDNTANIFREGISDNCRCQDGYYQDIDNRLICLKCKFPFETCSDENTAIACQLGYKRLDATNNCQCADKYYDNGVDLNCQLCVYPCIKCVNHSTNCLSCYSELNRSRAPSCSCQTGFYDNQQSCEECSNKCKSCFNKPDFCTDCADKVTRQNNSECSCKPGLKEIGLPECGECHIKCDSCYGGFSICTQCMFGQHRNLIQPTCGCIDGFFEVENEIDCAQCDPQCQNCENSSNNCIECANFELLPPLCETSKKGSLIVIDNDSGSIETKQCNFDCEICSESVSNCLSCKKGLNRMNSPPLCACLPGYHDESQNSEDCFKCPKDCITCPDSKYCYECEAGINRYLNKFNGQCECEQGFIENQNTLQCEKCYYFQDQCLTRCPDYTYADQINNMCVSQNFEEQNYSSIIYIGGIVICLFIIMYGLFIKINLNQEIQKSKHENSNSQPEIKQEDLEQKNDSGKKVTDK